MPLADYLTPERVLLLRSDSRQEVLHELLAVACAAAGEVEPCRAEAAVEAREREISTRIAPGIALPHARVPGLGRFVAAAGLSPQGIRWDPRDEQPVHLVVLLLGDAGQAQEHLRILGEIAQALRGEEVVPRLLAAERAPAALYRQLVELQHGGGPAEAGTTRQNRSLVAHAAGICRELQAATLMVLTDDPAGLRGLALRPPGCRAILATDDPGRYRGPASGFDAAVGVPLAGIARRHRLELAVLSALWEGLLDPGQVVICLYGGAPSSLLDSLRVVDLDRDFGAFLSLRAELQASDIDHHVLDRLLNLAIELAREGREGRPVGALFVLGDAERVGQRAQQMVANPFRGYAEEERHLLDPSLEETLKEFSLLDGAIVVRGDGVILSAGTYLVTEGARVEVEAGLGARHVAGAAITAATGAVAIVVSGSTGAVRLYKGGRAVLVLKRDLR
ncbi:MAG: diadenylate cyclase [Candidatus Latescibacterota bacterium]